MDRQGGRELAWILSTFVAALLLTFGVVELVEPRHDISLWLVAGLIWTSGSGASLALGFLDGDAEDNLEDPMANGEPQPDDEEAILGSAISLAQTQLLAQVADDASLDGRTTGLVGFNGALLAATIAAKDLLGTYWWVPLPVVGLSTVILVGSLFGRLERLLARKRRPGNLDLGKAAAEFFLEYGAKRAEAAMKQLLADLGGAFDANAKRIAAKRARFQASIGVLLCGLLFAALLIALNRPSNMESCQSLPPTQKAACVSRLHRADTSVPAVPSKNSSSPVTRQGLGVIPRGTVVTATLTPPASTLADSPSIWPSARFSPVGRRPHPAA